MEYAPIHLSVDYQWFAVLTGITDWKVPWFGGNCIVWLHSSARAKTALFPRPWDLADLEVPTQVECSHRKYGCPPSLAVPVPAWWKAPGFAPAVICWSLTSLETLSGCLFFSVSWSCLFTSMDSTSRSAPTVVFSLCEGQMQLHCLPGERTAFWNYASSASVQDMGNQISTTLPSCTCPSVST